MEFEIENDEKGILDVREFSELEKAFELAGNIVTKNYLSVLEKCNLISFPEEMDASIVTEQAALFRLKKIVYDKNENNLQKLINTYATASGLKNHIIMIVNSNGKEVELYFGTTGAKETSSARAASNALKNSFQANFPGSTGELLDNEEVIALLNNCTRPIYSSVASVSGVGSARTENDNSNEEFVQGLEKMIDAMQGTPFSAIFIANVIEREHLEDIKAEYEVLYSKLYPFLKSELAFNESSSDGVTKTLSESLSTTLTKSKSSALSVGTTESQSHTEGTSVTHTDSINVSTTKGVSAGAGFGGFNVGGFSSITTGYSHSIARSRNWSDTTSFGTTKTQSKTIGDSEAKGEIKSISDGTTKTETTGRTLSISYMNKSIQELLDRIDEQLARIKESENYGVFAMSAYFLAATPIMAKVAASAYKSLINGNCTHVENAYINSWQDESSVDTIKKYLRKLNHPVFEFNNANRTTTCSIVSGKELAIQMGLPHSSLPGIPVVETAAFGRNIMRDDKSDLRSIEIGNLYHMGKDDEGANGKIPVKLDIESLSMHTFVTGSTGSGKSTVIYSLLDKLMTTSIKDEMDKKVTFMVIEPTKGEYKDRFGYYKNVRVYGTNYRKTPLLKINPFSFPEDVHVLEHIDRLVEIFNVCWPMYAAMPAVLKDAVERAYMVCGWSLDVSECKFVDINGMPLYPNFLDVFNQIDIVMNESEYSADSKGDYKGALTTRLKSLTNGIYGQIFCNDEITSSELFDENVIVDLSRVGSSETKSLIMGLLVMKLQEHRMSNSRTGNQALRHITVLEEAHNILKRTSTEQSTESSNVLGKSVEMLANSIAEMRTYGEGFIIADQAPKLLDISVIRNTNTKIILRLPDMSDRELVGKATAMNSDQIIELSKLKTFVAAVYQNNWIEPVLCNIHTNFKETKKYVLPDSSGFKDDGKQLVVKYLVSNIEERNSMDSKTVDNLMDIVQKMNIPSEAKLAFSKFILSSEKKDIQRLRAKLLNVIFNSDIAYEMSKVHVGDIKNWYLRMCEVLEPKLSQFDDKECKKIIATLVKEKAEHDGTTETVNLFERLMSYL